jgi:molybdopterin molybdotransferase
VASLVKYCGAVPEILNIAHDTEASLINGFQKGLAADMLITSGGVSLGDYDIVKDILVQQGEIAFWTVRMKPGKPIAFGMMRGVREDGTETSVPHLGLPGNPVSAMVTFDLFARAAIRKMMGKPPLARQIIQAELGEEVVNLDGRRIFSRVFVEKRGDGYYAGLTGPQGSGILTSMVWANGLAIIPEDRDKVAAGETVSVMMLDWREG